MFYLIWRVRWQVAVPKKVRELTALDVKRLTHPGRGRNITVAVGGVSGLLLQITPAGSRTWILRAMVGSKRREVGLGAYPDVPLALARERAREAKEMILRTNLFTLEAQLHHAAIAAKATIDALPADLPVESELDQISAASAPAYALADEMVAMCPRDAAEVALRARAVAWLEGRYWSN